MECRVTNTILAVLLVFSLGFTRLLCADEPSELEQVKQRLKSSAEQLSLTIFLEVPEAPSYLNFDMVKNAPHKMNLTKELTKIIREWSPRLLALDPTCPYYFSKFNDPTSSDEGLNLLSYLQAIEENTTVARPFLNVLPQSYRHAIPLLSLFHCSEYVYAKSQPFFENVELLVGPGQSDLALERRSDQSSQLYCSLFGWPHHLLVNQTKQPSVTYDSQHLLSASSLAKVDFVSTTVAPGSCLYVPAGWTNGVQLNNSISLVFTLKKMEAAVSNATDYEPLPCTTTGESTLDSIEFAVSDTFNITEIGLVVYFYQYLNPPMFDKEFTPETFLEAFRNDKNVSQLIMKWTPELSALIRETLFKHLDINHDGKFSANDYFDIKQSGVQQIQKSIYDILEQLRQTVLSQYNDLNATITKITQQIGKLGSEADPQAALESMLDSLPEGMKQKLREKNANIGEALDKINRNKQKPKRTTGNTERTREDDASLLFDQNLDEQVQSVVNGDEEEEIVAEPADESHRTDL